jgi:hypothetical protein
LAFTPVLWKSQTQVNTSDAPVAPGGSNGQFDPQIAHLQDGGYVVVWVDQSGTFNANGSAVVGQRYNSAGNKVGGEVYISQSVSENQFSPAVAALPNGNIAVAFVDRFDPAPTDSNIVVRIFDSALNYIRTDVIDAGANQTVEPSITVFANGNYVVSYTLSNTASDSDIVARVVNSATGVVGGQFDIDNQTDNRHVPQLATLSNGNFVAVYQDEVSGSTTNTDIMYRIFTPAGAPVTFAGVVPGGAFTGLEIDPDVAALGDGNFVVVWTDPDSTVTDIRATILSSTTGGAVGIVTDNILVNTTTTNAQHHASVMALPDGGFLVSWYDGSTQYARAQRFDPVGNKLGAEFVVKSAAGQLSSPEAALLTDGRIAYAVSNVSSGDFDVATSIWAIPPNPNPIPPVGTTADLILRQSSSGFYQIYDIGNDTILAGYELGQVGLDWQFAGLGRFFGSDTTDMLLRNTSTGGFEVYDISNNNITGAAFLGPVGLNWQVAGFGDFNHDSMTDMVLRNSSTGAFQVYNIVNNSITTSASLGTVGLNWQVGGFGNFSSLGETDMILRNTSTGGLEVYDINNNHITGAAFIGTVGLDWQIIAVGNFSSMPGESDMIMRNTSTSGLQVYNIANNQITGSAFLGTVGLDWQFAGVAPVHGPGTADLVLRNVSTGQFEVYDIANNQITGAAPLGSVGLDWQLGGFAVDPPTASGGFADLPNDRLVQTMAAFGGGGAAESLNVPAFSDVSQQALLTAPQHA